MRRLVVLAVVASLMGVSTEVHALSCVPPAYTTPQELVSRGLDGYDEVDTIPPFDLFLVGTVIYRGDLPDDHPGFGHRILRVVVAGAFGDPLDTAVIDIASTVWLDGGEPGGPEEYPVMLPLWLKDDGLYHHGMCTFGPGIDGELNPYEMAEELTPIADAAGLRYQLFPVSALTEARSATTPPPVPPSTTIPVMVNPRPGQIEPPVEVENPLPVSLPATSPIQDYARLAILVLVIGAGVMVWRTRRASAQAATATDDDNFSGDV